MVPVPRAPPTRRNLVAGLPRVKRCSHRAPSRFRRGDELLRERVDHAGADPMQAPGRPVGAVLELPPGVERGEDDLERIAPALLVPVDGDAASVVGDRHRPAVGVERDADVRGMPVHRLVDGVVEDLPDQMMQPGRAHAADVHAGTAAHRLQPFEDGNVLGAVALCHQPALTAGRANRVPEVGPGVSRQCSTPVFGTAPRQSGRSGTVTGGGITRVNWPRCSSSRPFPPRPVTPYLAVLTV